MNTLDFHSSAKGTNVLPAFFIQLWSCSFWLSLKHASRGQRCEWWPERKKQCIPAWTHKNMCDCGWCNCVCVCVKNNFVLLQIRTSSWIKKPLSEGHVCTTRKTGLHYCLRGGTHSARGHLFKREGWLNGKQNRKLISYPSHVADNAVSFHADSYLKHTQSTF